MSIVYAAVVRGSTGAAGAGVGVGVPLILVDFQQPDRSPRSVDVREILGKVPTQYPSRQTQTTDRYLFHILVEVHSLPGGTQMSMVYVCVTEPNFDKATAFALLEHVQSMISSSSDCLTQVSKVAGTTEKPMQTLLEGPLAKAVGQFCGENEEKEDKMAQLRQQVSEVQQIMRENVEKVLERGDRLDDLMDRSGELEASASNFRATSRQVRRSMCWKNWKCNIIIASIVLLVIFIVVMVILWDSGAFDSKKSSGAGGKTTTAPHGTE